MSDTCTCVPYHTSQFHSYIADVNAGSGYKTPLNQSIESAQLNMCWDQFTCFVINSASLRMFKLDKAQQLCTADLSLQFHV